MKQILIRYNDIMKKIINFEVKERERTIPFIRQDQICTWFFPKCKGLGFDNFMNDSISPCNTPRVNDSNSYFPNILVLVEVLNEIICP
jgi:hypothetical protein